MRVACLVFSLVSVICASLARPAAAYEYEHYAWTYFIAVHMGFTERQAFQIASATYAVDWDNHTGPMTSGNVENLTVLAAGAWASLREKWTKFHAFTLHEMVYDGRKAGKSEAEIAAEVAAFKQAAQDVLWGHAVRQQNPGPYLHYVQDIRPHNGWTNLYGHGSAVHMPDFASWDEASFRGMTADTVRELRHFRDTICAAGPRDFCTRPLRDPDPIAVERAMLRIFAANPVPITVDDRAALFRDFMTLSIGFEPVSRLTDQLKDVNSILPDPDFDDKIRTIMAFNLAAAVDGTVKILAARNVTFRGTLPGPLTWLTETPGPALEPPFKVIVEELAMAKAGASPLISVLDPAAGLAEFGEVNADMPRDWLPYTFDAVGAITGPSAAMSLEDPRVKLPDDGTVTVVAEGPYDELGETIYFATLKFSITMEGMADLPFLPKLPVAVVSTPDPRFPPQIFRNRMDNTTTFDVEHYMQWKASDITAEEMPWLVDVHVYGLPKITRTWKVTFPKRNTCNSAVKAGGDEGGQVTVDLQNYSGPAGFTWEMYDIKDQMTVKIGSEEKTTGCVSGSGVFRFDVPAGAKTADVTVGPNCSGGTSGTAWTLTFECPLRSAVTADGAGNPVPGTAPPIPPRPPLSIPVPVGLPMPGGLLGPTDNIIPAAPASGTTNDTEPNGTEGTAEPAPSVPLQFAGAFDPPGDVDFVTFDATGGGEIVLALSGAAAGLFPDAGIFAAPGGPWLPDESPPGDDRLVIDLPGPGRYVLRLAAPGGTTTALGYALAAALRPAPDAFEPNGAAAVASPLATDGRLIGAILPRGDVDFFAVTFPKAGEWTVTAAAAPAAMALETGVYAAAGGPWLADESPPGDGMLVADIPAPGRYILRVADTNNQRSPDPYAIDLAFAASADPAEPNATEGSATPISADGTVAGTILPRGDADMLVADMAGAGTWRIAVTESPANMALGLGVYAAAGGPWLPDLTPPGDGVLEVDLPAPGRYMLRVVDDNNGRSPAPWRLETGFTPGADAGEPNGTAESATAVGLAGPVSGAILPGGDADNYIAVAPGAGEWRLTVADFGDAPNLEMGVYAAWGGPWLPDLTPPGDGVLAVDLAAAGPYVLLVQDAQGARGPRPYRIDAAFTATDDAFEPNDRESAAMRIPADGSFRAAFLPQGDADYFAAPLPGPGEWQVTVTDAPAGLHPEAGVYDAAGGPWLADLTPPGDGVLRVKIPAGGLYMLRIGELNNLRSPLPYTMTTAFRAD